MLHPDLFSDVTNPAYHNFNQPSVPDWSYPNHYMPQSQYYEHDWNNHHYSSQSQWGYNSPESYCNYLTNILLDQRPFTLVLMMTRKIWSWIGMIIDNMTRGSCIPIDSVKSSDDCSSLVHNIETGAYIDSDKTNRHTWLVKVVKCLVGVIWKRGRGIIWITIFFEKIIIIIHITQELSKTKQQTHKQKKENFILS